MRKLFVAVSALLALPLAAQQKSSGVHDGNTGTAAEKSVPASTASKASGVVRLNGIFALPAVPRPTPFPGSASAAKGAVPPGRLVPKFELGSMYSYINFSPG